MHFCALIKSKLLTRWLRAMRVKFHLFMRKIGQRGIIFSFIPTWHKQNLIVCLHDFFPPRIQHVEFYKMYYVVLFTMLPFKKINKTKIKQTKKQKQLQFYSIFQCIGHNLRRACGYGTKLILHFYSLLKYHLNAHL